MTIGNHSARRAQQLDRAIGAVLASAAGDALGSQYEFEPELPDHIPVEFGLGTYGHARGEWTDDTSMAIPVLRALSLGHSPNDPDTLAQIVAEWHEWSLTAPDVGTQTRSVLSAHGGDYSEQNARTVAESHHVRAGKSGGNGSLMRTGPLALGYLDDGREPDLIDAAARLAQLTHWEDDNIDACVLWCLAIRHAILTGELDIRSQLEWVRVDRRDRWAALIDEALRPGAHPRDFQHKNVWVVRAFQGALAAIAGAKASTDRPQLVDAIERAIRGGGDTDTVAAIAGSLAGALWGASQVPLAWQRQLHGWPGLRANDLVSLSEVAVRGGAASGSVAASMSSSKFLHTPPRPHPHDDGVGLGSVSALEQLPSDIDAVVSLSRVEGEQVPGGVESIRVRLIDHPGHNANLDWVLTDTVDTISALRSEGKRVFVHCAEARSRTAAIAALYAARHCGVPIEQAWTDVAAALPYFDPALFLREAVARIIRGAG